MKPQFNLSTYSLNLSIAQQEQLKKVDSTLCLYRWSQPCLQIDSGLTKLCCRTKGQYSSKLEIENKKSEIILNSDFNKNRRLEMLHGIKHSDCQQCWNMEEKGFKSPRLGLNDFVQYYEKYSEIDTDTLIQKIINSNTDLLESHKPFMLEVSLGNLCNLSCVYCDEEYSSRWASEKIAAGELPISFNRDISSLEKDLKLNAFWDWMALEGALSLKCLCFIGGETILNPELFKFLNKLYEVFQMNDIFSKRKNKIVIQIVSNMNISENIFEKFLSQTNLLTEFFKFEILASMESVNEKAEYIRYGLSWPLFDRNVNKLLSFQQGKKDYVFGFITTINLMSLSSTKQFLEYAYSLFKKYGLPIYLGKNIVSYPKHLSVNILDSTYIKYIDEAIEFLESIPELEDSFFNKDKTWTGYIDFLNDIKLGLKSNNLVDLIEINNLKKWIEKHDLRRGTDFLKLFPEYKDLI